MSTTELSTPHRGRARRRAWVVGAVVAMVMAASLGALRKASARADAVNDLVGRCQADMMRGVCRVQTGSAASGAVDTVVYVANTGAIDPTAYRELRDAGPAVCSLVRDSCTHAWDGLRCKAARALHGMR